MTLNYIDVLERGLLFWPPVRPIGLYSIRFSAE